MFYHPDDNKITIIIKHLMLLTSFIALIALFIFAFNADSKIPQREIVEKIDVKDRINICLPEQDDMFEKSFFEF